MMGDVQELACGGCGCPSMRLRGTKPGGGGFTDIATICQGCGSVSHIRLTEPRMAIVWGRAGDGEKDDGLLTTMAWGDKPERSYGDALVHAIQQRTGGALPLTCPNCEGSGYEPGGPPGSALPCGLCKVVSPGNDPAVQDATQVRASRPLDLAALSRLGPFEVESLLGTPTEATVGALAAQDERLEAAGLAMEQARNLLRQAAEVRYGRARRQDQADNLTKQAVRTLTEALAALEQG
jgi:hypothetical protein